MGLLGKLFGASEGESFGRSVGRATNQELLRGLRQRHQLDRAAERERELREARSAARASGNTHAYRESVRELQQYRRTMGEYGPNRLTSMEQFARTAPSYANTHEFEKAFRHYERTGQIRPGDSGGRRGGGSFASQQIRMAAAGAISSDINSVARHVPLVGPAAGHAIGTGLNAMALGAGFGTSLALGGIVGAGSLVAQGINMSYDQYAKDESLLLQMSRMGGVGYAKRAVGAMRGQGFLNNEIMQSAIPLAHATGSFAGLDSVARLQHTYGLGSNAIGLMGALSQTGAQGDQSQAVKDAIAAGMVTGLQRGRFHEMVDGLRRIVQSNALGVTVDAEGMGKFSAFAGAMGRQVGMGTALQGSQLTGALGLMDSSLRGHGGVFGQNLGFFSAFQFLNSPMSNMTGPQLPVTATDILKLQEKGLTGKGGGGTQLALNALKNLAAMSGVEARDLYRLRDGTKEERAAAKPRMDVFDNLINQSLLGGSSLAASEKLRNAYLGGTFDDKTVDEAMKDARTKEEQAYDEIIEQTSIMRNIERNTEAMGRLSVFGDQDKWNRMVEGVSSKIANPERYRTTQELVGLTTEKATPGGVLDTSNLFRALHHAEGAFAVPGTERDQHRFDTVLSGADFIVNSDMAAVPDLQNYIRGLSRGVSGQRGVANSPAMSSALDAATKGVLTGVTRTDGDAAVADVVAAANAEISRRESGGEVMSDDDKEKFRKAVALFADTLTGLASQFDNAGIKTAKPESGVATFMHLVTGLRDFAKANDASAALSPGPTTGAPMSGSTQ